MKGRLGWVLRRAAVGSLLVLGALGLVAYRARSTGRVPFLAVGGNTYSVAIYEGPSLTELAPLEGASTPALVARDVTDLADPILAADPFWVRRDGLWYLFFEVATAEKGRGVISLATSPDARRWSYRGVVLREDFHLSYPNVFHHQGEDYMVPETNDIRQVRLYRAARWPDRWEFVGLLHEGQRLVDPTVFPHRGRWYMFASTPFDTSGLLFHADALTGPWGPHPASPVVPSDRSRTRMAGRVLQDGPDLLRFVQDRRDGHGRRVRAWRITRLDATSFAEEPALPGAVLDAGAAGWNRAGMHHIDAVRTPEGRWIACVDGRGDFVQFSPRFGW